MNKKIDKRECFCYNSYVIIIKLLNEVKYSKETEI